MGWLSGWSYRKSITLSRSSGAVSNYQMKLLVGESSGATGEDVDCGGHCLSNFNDLRFTKSDGTTLLDYWIESTSGSTPNQLATVWIEFDSIGTGDTTFYMYYGKADASSVSSGANTFPFFDDFLDSSIDSSKWDVTTAGNGSVVVGSGVCTFSATSANDRGKITSKATFGVNTAIRSRVKTNKASAQDVNMRYGYLYDTPSANRITYYGNWKQAVYKWSTFSGGSETVTSDDAFAANEYAIVEQKRNSTTSVLYDFNGTNKATHTTNVPTGSYPFVCDAQNGGWTVNFNIVLDWVAVRQYLATEPTFGSWGAEEVVPSYLPLYMQHHYIPPFLGGN